MTKHEAICTLSLMATELVGELAGTDSDESNAKLLKRYIDSVNMAISALRQLETVTDRNGLNEPLTPDELRKMDGQPVWLHTFSPAQKKTNIAQWAILETVGGGNATFLRAGVNTRLTKCFCNYGKTWLAYRQKPEEVEHV